MMMIEQTVEVPVSHRITLDVPPEIPSGTTNVILTFPTFTQQPVSANNAAWREFIAAIKEIGPLPGDDLPPRWNSQRETCRFD